ncbi:hypothetical protein E3T61_21170 [Cryobacterium lactosi]|uniref:Resolvase HTH domain-containing protein n=1 Tax=Cryobacterium lactosi TaxID=1259202 RepID=A0A4R9BG36_9MICO|nr:helix-turn-helix domain-containing protein [Cryobacterium lactosi]TFD83546.1 hypothetical protein E3T61_21170 [Cryobacterium lactosi]
MGDWAKIRQLFSTGEHSKREIGRLVGISRATVKRALETDRLPKRQRPAMGSTFDVRAVRDKVAGIRPEYVPPDPPDRLVHEPGRQVQCDLWFPHEPLPLGNGQEGTPSVLVMTSTFSGFFQALMLPSRKILDLFGGMGSLLQTAQAVPKRLLWDNGSGIGRGKLTEPTVTFAGPWAPRRSS